MTSFQELRKGGCYSMTTRYCQLPTPVHVYSNSIDPKYIIVKYLSGDQRGSLMGLHESQIHKGLCIFSKKTSNQIDESIYKNTLLSIKNYEDNIQQWIDTRDTIILIGLCIILGSTLVLIYVETIKFN
jgi:hypothetical protein